MSSLLDQLGEDPTREDSDQKLRDLLEKQHLILEMQQTAGWALWKDFLAAVSEKYQNRLLLGRHQDMLDVRYDAGLVEGIRTALGASGTLAGMVSAQREILSLTQTPAELEEDTI